MARSCLPCVLICLAGWAVCIVAEHLTGTVQVTAGGENGLLQSAVPGQPQAAGGGLSDAQRCSGLQQYQEQQQGPSRPLAGFLHRVFASFARLAGRPQSTRVGSGANGLSHGHSTDGSSYDARGARLKYAELVSKDSGPDLSAGVSG